MDIIPIADKLLVKVDKGEAGEPPLVQLVKFKKRREVFKGTVIRKGPGKTNKFGLTTPIDVEEGEKIAFLIPFEMGPQDIGKEKVSEILGDDFLLIKEENILFVITEGNPKVEDPKVEYA
jgi:co-chaperonin GroES (HSP10)